MIYDCYFPWLKEMTSVPEGAAVQQPSFLKLNETVSILQSENRHPYETLPDLQGSDLRISKITVVEQKNAVFNILSTYNRQCARLLSYFGTEWNKISAPA